ncbi:MAG: GNAT family N-acetyltransferase [Tepidisphaeraceae bacterium]|jgi:aminoglycoside 6'-N-acetyltransferase I
MPVEIKLLQNGEEYILANVAADVFDNAVDKNLTTEFLADPRHHLAVALDNGQVVGMASGVHYVHPDKRPQLFINEVAVAPAHRAAGVGKALLGALLEEGRRLGCTEAWVLTDRDNRAAMRLYASLGGEEATKDQVMFTFWLNSYCDPAGVP